MKQIVILGAGTAGTIVANGLSKRLPADWRLTVVDPETRHLYQPDLIFIPFGSRDDPAVQRDRASTLRDGVTWIQEAVSKVDPDARQVVLANDERLAYDLLVIASGSHIRPQETPGLAEGEWRKTIFDYYTLEGARALRDALSDFDGGRLLVNVVEMPIKCPVAPLEFTFLADAYFHRRGIRDRVELVFSTPLDGAFTRPVAAAVLGDLLERKGVHVETEFSAAEVDTERKVLRSYDERELPYDLLVSIPTHMGADFVEASGLGDDLAFVPTDKHSLLAKGHDDIFVLGDATNLPSSKAGSVAHFQSEVVIENVLHAIRGESLAAAFDGHSNCFVESGFGKAMLIDFNYVVEPLPGRFPFPLLGPMSLLKESRMNHWGKLGFRWLYWNALLPGRPLPVSNQLSMAGKRSSEAALQELRKTA